MPKHRPPQELAKELRELKKKLAKQKRDIDESKKRLHLCLKECMKKLEHPPWHYGPHCR
jgi:hypothetical protein